MNNPIITASGAIPAYSCVKVSTIANKVAVCTTSTDTVFGVTLAADTANGGEVVFQTSDTQLDIVTLRAGGTIAAGDELVPAAAGAVVTASIGQFIAMSAATSGQTLTAYKKKVGSSVSPVGVYGSREAARFVAEAVNNTASLDCLWIGDSNTGYNGWGWCDGFQHGLSQAGANIYGSMLWFPWNSQPNIGYRSHVNASFSAYPLTNLVAGTGGSSGASAGLKSTYSVGGGQLTIQGNAGTSPDFVDVPSARTGDGYTEVDVRMYMRNIQTGSSAAIDVGYTEPMPIGFNDSLTFRAQVNLRTGGTAQLKSRWGTTANGELYKQTYTTVSPSTTAWTTYTHTIPAASRFVYPGTGAQEFIKVSLDGSGVGGADAIKAGTSLGICSVYRNIIGTSCSIMEYRGSATLTQIASDISLAATGFCNMLLKETRERQIAAGGTGRVLICIQGGVNSGDWSPSNPAAAITAVESIKTSLKTQWAALGYAATDLYFLFMVSHPFDAGDASLTVLRTYAQAYYTNSTDTLFVNLNGIAPYTKILSNNWYDNGGNAHLDEATRGYEAISSAIVNNICKFA